MRKSKYEMSGVSIGGLLFQEGNQPKRLPLIPQEKTRDGTGGVVRTEKKEDLTSCWSAAGPIFDVG